MANIFLTGGTGFVGTHLLKALVREGHQLWCLTRRPHEPSGHDNQVHWIQADLINPGSYITYLGKADYIFHLASTLQARRKETYLSSNAAGTESLLNACIKAGGRLKRFVHMSSIAAMGPKEQDLPLKESDICMPNSEYGKSKLLAERIALDYGSRIPVVILRPSFIYGPGDTRGLMFVRSLFENAVSGWVFHVRSLSLCHVSDVVQSCLLSVRKKIKSGETFIVSDGMSYSWNQILKVFEQTADDFRDTEYFGKKNFKLLLQHAADFAVASSRQNHGQYWGCEITKSMQILDFQPHMTLRKGAHDLFRWGIESGFF